MQVRQKWHQSSYNWITWKNEEDSKGGMAARLRSYSGSDRIRRRWTMKKRRGIGLEPVWM